MRFGVVMALAAIATIASTFSENRVEISRRLTNSNEYIMKVTDF
jgi:hypothetical protein